MLIMSDRSLKRDVLRDVLRDELRDVLRDVLRDKLRNEHTYEVPTCPRSGLSEGSRAGTPPRLSS